MARRDSPLRFLAISVLSAAPLFADAAPAGAAFKTLKVGMEAADLSFKRFDGGEVTLASLKEGSGSLLVFWATWSPKSEPALREAQALHEKHGAAGLRVVAVNLNRPDVGLQEQGLIEKAVQAQGLTMPVVIDPGFASSSGIGVVANPSIALLDGRGVLVWEGAGWSKSLEEELRAEVELLLGLRQPPAGDAAAAVKRHVPERKVLLNYNLGRTFLRQGNAGKARTLFEAAADADPQWAAPRVLLGHLLLAQGGADDLAQAEPHFCRACEIDPADVSALAGLGEVLLRTNRVEEAAGLFEKAHALDPAFTPAVAGRAMALTRLGRAAEARTLYDQALELNPRDAAVIAGRAECRELEGKPAEAVADYRQAVEILLGAR
jgi:Flp pilus assembly protein TadD/peroxiredoxin